jgi:hypothetical protein
MATQFVSRQNVLVILGAVMIVGPDLWGPLGTGCEIEAALPAWGA